MNIKNLLPPQVPHTKKLIDSINTNGFSVDMSDLGTGKTYVAASMALNLNVPVVVVCPKISMHTWNAVFKLFGITPYAVINYEKLIRGSTIYLKYKKKLYVNGNHWESGKAISINFPDNALVILDEAHKTRGVKSHTSRFLVALKHHGFKFHLMSATIATNPLDMRAFGQAVNLHKGEDFRAFLKECGGYNDGFGGLKLDFGSDVTQNAMKAIHKKLFEDSKCASRMIIKDFGTAFPSNHISAQAFDMGKNSAIIQDIYDEMERELAKLDDRIKNYSQHHFATLIAGLRKIELLKVPTIVEMVENYVENNTSPVVFLNFTDTIQAVISRLTTLNLGHLIATIIGGQSVNERQTDIDNFNADKKRIIVGQSQAGSLSISLHDLHGNFPRNSIISPSFRAIDMMQLLGRICRAEGKTHVNQTFVYAGGTIEENIAYKLNKKIQSTGALNDGDLVPDFSIFN